MQRRDFISICAQSAVFGSAGLTFVHPKRIETSSFDSARIEKLVSGWINEFKIPGASIAFIHHGKLVWSKGFGVRSTVTKEPVDSDTLFEAASVSKTVFAYAVMKLVETKVISLDTPLSSYYPELFGKGDPRLKLITARQVLSHTSGLPNMRTSNPIQFDFDPGKGFGYSGEGFYFLQTVLSHLKGQKLDEPCGTYEADTRVCATDFAPYMKRNVLIPNGMKDSTYELDYSTAGNVATPHNQSPEPYSKHPFNPADVARYASLGGLVTNAKEYSKFIIGLFHPAEGHSFLLNKASITEMLRPQCELPKGGEIDGCTQWALGWGINDTPMGRLIVHSGGQQGIQSLMMFSQEHENGFVVFTNSDNGGHLTYRLREELTPMLFA